MANINVILNTDLFPKWQACRIGIIIIGYCKLEASEDIP